MHSRTAKTVTRRRVGGWGDIGLNVSIPNLPNPAHPDKLHPLTGLRCRPSSTGTHQTDSVVSPMKLCRLTGGVRQRLLPKDLFPAVPDKSSMNATLTSNSRPAGHVLAPAAAIGGLSTLLGAGLSLLGALDRLNFAIARIVSLDQTVTYPKALPLWSQWLAAVLIAFAVSFSILSVAGAWRRWLLWVSTIVLTAAWAPVLSLAAHAPEIAAPLVTALWSGACAIVYAGKHLMPCDEVAETSSPESPDETR